MRKTLGATYKGTEEWVNKQTGEIINVDTIVKHRGRDEPFMITYLHQLLILCDSLGNKKMYIAKYIINEMCKTNNVLVITTMELAKKTKTSRQTVSDTLKIMEEAGLIKRKVGSLMVNPKLINNKNAWKEKRLMIEFDNY